MKKIIEVYTDGSSLITTKTGGYGWVLVVNGIKYLEGNGYLRRADNNEAELEAALRGIEEVWNFISQESLNGDHQTLNYEVTLFSDSQIVLSWASGIYFFKQELKYQKFSKLKELVQLLNVKTKWIRGHSGHKYNERSDELATLGRLKFFHI